MFELFPDQPVYDYPTLINVGYSLVWAFALSSLIAITHRITYTGPEYPKHLFQSLALGSIVAAMVMMAIGDSLARGLGAFGALAMIRFRTRIQDPRNILFIFASLSSGLAVGVYGFTIAFAGTILFCGMALVLHFTNFTTRGQIKAELPVQTYVKLCSLTPSNIMKRVLVYEMSVSMHAFLSYYPTHTTISRYWNHFVP